MKRRKQRKGKHQAFNFTLMDELTANPDQPVPQFRLESHLKRVSAGLDALMRDKTPALEAWKDLSDGINILSSAAELGIVQDETNECQKAKNAMGEAGDHHMRNGTIRLTGPGVRCLRELLVDYAEVISAMSERDFVRCCRHAERRIRAILAGQKQSGDKVMAL